MNHTNETSHATVDRIKELNEMHESLKQHGDITVMMEIHDTSKMFKDYIRHSGDKEGINSTYHRIMGAIDHLGKVSQSDLVKITNLKAPTISLMLKNMEYEGLIQKEVDEKDARVVLISFTSKGKELSKKNVEYIRGKEREFEQLLTVEERNVLMNALSKIQKEIKDRNENI